MQCKHTDKTIKLLPPQIFWNFFQKMYAKMLQKREFNTKHSMLRAKNLHLLRKFNTSAACDV